MAGRRAAQLALLKAERMELRLAACRSMAPRALSWWLIEQHNAAPKPFRWTKSASDILASAERFCTRNTAART